MKNINQSFLNRTTRTFAMETDSLVWYLLLAAASVIVYCIHRNLNYWKRRGIPHEEPHIFWGNLQGLRSKYHLAEITAKYYHKFKGSGPFAGIFLFVRPAVVLLEAEAIKLVMVKEFSTFIDRGIYCNEKDDPLFSHLVSLSGEKWRYMRNKLSPAFTSSKSKAVYSTVHDIANLFVKVLEEKAKENPVQEVRDLLARYTTDVIASVAFGIQCNSLTNPDDNFLKMGRNSLDVPRHNNLVRALIESFPNLARKLGMRLLNEEAHQFFMKTIRETVDYREKNNIQRNDFLNILIEMKNDKSASDRLTIEQLSAQVYGFFIGGYETSSTTMSHALYELALNQDMQERLRDDINEVFDSFKDDQISYEAIMNIPYLNQVLCGKLLI